MDCGKGCRSEGIGGLSDERRMALYIAEYTELGMFDTGNSLTAQQIAQLNEEAMGRDKKELSIKLTLSGLPEKTLLAEIFLGDHHYYKNWGREIFRYLCHVIIQ